MSRVGIVRLEEAHLAGFWALVDSVAREERHLIMLEAPPIDDMRKFIAEGLARRWPRFVALLDGAVVGWCDAIEKPRPALAHSAILGMGVLAAHRGKGIGRALLKRTLAAAKDRGYTRIELSVRADNERAKKLYERFGFVVEGLSRRHMRIRGEYFDSYIMALVYD